jgi:hypothetical protein
MKKSGLWVLLLVLTIAFSSCFNGGSDGSDNGDSTPQTYEWIQKIDTIQGTLSVGVTNGRNVINSGGSIYDTTFSQTQNYSFTLHKSYLAANRWEVWNSDPPSVSGSLITDMLIGLETGTDAYERDTCNCSAMKYRYTGDVHMTLDCDTNTGKCTLNFNGGAFSNCLATDWDIINKEYLLGPDEPVGDSSADSGTIKNIPLLTDSEITNGTNKAVSTLIGQMKGIDQIHLNDDATQPLANANWELNAYMK